jgi:agmatine deiminase
VVCLPGLPRSSILISASARRSRDCAPTMSTPAQPGNRMPAEWEAHEATWIAWPHNKDDWPGKFAAIPWVYTEIVRHLAVAEEVRILVNGPAGERRARDALGKVLPPDTERVTFWRIPTDRAWTRDYGPMFVVVPNGDRAILKWQFNGWAKYPNYQRDNAVAGRAWNALGPRCRPPDGIHWLNPDLRGRRVVLEGGAIDVNGRGALLTTEECLLSKVQQRNPGLKRRDYERLFAESLGVRKVIWLGRGIVGDDTHGHVDDLARFVGPGTVATVVEWDPADANYRPLQENLERLRGATDQDGGKLEVVALPMPAPVYFDGQRLPASYANFYIANDRVLVPTFNDPRDRQALGILAELFPGREVIGIHAVDLVWGLGTLHCLTQQQPAAGPCRRGER